MICKTLNQNYLLKHYLTKRLVIVFSIISIFCLWAQSSPSALATGGKIINGSTPEDTDEENCSEAELLDYVEEAKKYIGSKWQPVKGFEDRNIVVVFTVNKNGKIEDEKIVEESGSQ